ncbi:hypothetical protein [Candidatus Electronema sp. TJ]|uniref:hypothetical protein n=1 Tax=Candidatus Electronema sp. TJ TaxID=3401573 RepID=UPI003AA8A52A
MPDTLAHFGIQIIASKALFREADARWIGIGCLLPDLPWILQRAALALGWANPVGLRLYAVIQSSLFFSLLLAAALSLQAAQSRRVFLLLTWNCLLHLLLDPLEIKWGNGSLLAAPFSWQLTSFALFWPEDMPPRLLALLGLLLFPAAAWLDIRRRELCFIRNKQRQAAGLLLLLLYILLPFGLFSGPLKKDNHFAATLLAENRSSSWIDFDRWPYQAGSQSILAYSGETLRLAVPFDSLPAQDGTLSGRGRFLSHSEVLLAEWHLHRSGRDLRSLAGLFLLIAVWSVAIREKRITIRRPC